MNTSITTEKVTITNKKDCDTPWPKQTTIIIWGIWILLLTVTTGLFIVTTPQRFLLLQSHLIEQEIALYQLFASLLELLPGFLRPLLLMGLSNHFLALYVTIAEFGAMFVFFVTAAIVFWRRSRDWLPIFISLGLLAFGSTIFMSVNLLETNMTSAAIWVRFVRSLGWTTLIIAFYVFPNGYFVPRWTHFVALVWTALNVIWVFWSKGAFVESISTFWLWVTGFGIASAVSAQIYRYRHFSHPAERQQAKWVGFGFIIPLSAFVLYQFLHNLAAQDPTPAYIFYGLVSYFIFIISLLVFALFISSAVFGYRLWDIDPIINNTLVYGIVLAFLGLFYFVEVLIFQQIFQLITSQNSTLTVAASTLLLAVIFKPILKRWKKFIDQRFYREKIDFRQAFVQFSSEVRTIIDLQELLQVLVTRISNLMYVSHGAVFLYKQGQFQLARTYKIPSNKGLELKLNKPLFNRLCNGETVSMLRSKTFPLIVPLRLPRPETCELIGILALGPHVAKRKYSGADQKLLIGLADQAGIAIYVAQLIAEKQVEAQQKEEVERSLANHRNSPLGQAEMLAKELVLNPTNILLELDQLLHQAEQDPQAASLIDNLPTVLENHKDPLIQPLATLTEGFNYLFMSQFTPEVLPVGLRKMIEAFNAQNTLLRDNQGQPWLGSSGALETYQISQMILEPKTIPQLTELLPTLAVTEQKIEDEKSIHFIKHLRHALLKLYKVAETLHAYERVNATRDKLAYLASGVEQLRHIDHFARTELHPPERPIVRQAVEQWLTVCTNAMSDLQTSAQLVILLLTRHTLQDDAISLAVSIQNKGRGAALNLELRLAPALEYELVGNIPTIKRLASGEEVEIQFRLRINLNEGVDHFRVRFNVHYTDPRGPDQVEVFADEVYLLAPENDFQFIPNPYVVGTPLQPGSPLFFGRQDIVAVVQENLAAKHRNNLVLIGQRRTGKTSFLKQLPTVLGDEYLPVYVDGQTLGLDPGLPNFFLTLSTEITFALEDYGYDLALPELEDFTDSPASAFERKFLMQVRQTIGDRHLLILLDEFEELESAVRRGNLESSIFGFLRHLIQHSDNLSVIFCGTHRLEELASDYWNVLFNISLYRHIGALNYEDALRLIQEPVARYSLRYDDLALGKMWRVTAGHPYFLQLICHSLVNHHNKTERNYMTIADVNAALDEIMVSGEAHFIFLWLQSGLAEKLVLVTVSRIIPLTGRVTPAQVGDYLAEHAVFLERGQIVEALHRLVLRDILQRGDDVSGDIDETYRWQLGLLGLWIERYKSLSRVLDEEKNYG